MEKIPEKYKNAPEYFFNDFIKSLPPAYIHLTTELIALEIAHEGSSDALFQLMLDCFYAGVAVDHEIIKDRKENVLKYFESRFQLKK